MSAWDLGLVAVVVFESVLNALRAYVFSHTTSRIDVELGAVTALGHDAALMATILATAGALDRRGLTRSDGFAGVLGGFRFLEDGRCQRDLTVVTVEGGQIVAIGEVSGA